MGKADHSLSNRETQILAFIRAGQTTVQIAAQLGISPHTVENHRSNIIKKLGLSGKNALLHYVAKASE